MENHENAFHHCACFSHVQSRVHSLLQNQDVAIQDDVQKRLDEHDQNQEKEVPVVLPADAVVQPDAVVVELLTTPVAPAAVLRVLQDVSIAELAVVIIVVLVEFLVCNPTVPLLSDSAIGRVNLGGDVAESDYCDVEEDEENSGHYPEEDVRWMAIVEGYELGYLGHLEGKVDG